MSYILIEPYHHDYGEDGDDIGTIAYTFATLDEAIDYLVKKSKWSAGDCFSSRVERFWSFANPGTGTLITPCVNRKPSAGRRKPGCERLNSKRPNTSG